MRTEDMYHSVQKRGEVMEAARRPRKSSSVLVARNCIQTVLLKNYWS